MVGAGGHEVTVVRAGPWLVEDEVEENTVDDGKVEVEDGVLDTSEEVMTSEEEGVGSDEDNEDESIDELLLLLLASETVLDSAEGVLELLAGTDTDEEDAAALP